MVASIQELEQRIERVKMRLCALGDLRPGSLSEQYNVCGNPRCRCKDDPPQKHGPYQQLGDVLLLVAVRYWALSLWADQLRMRNSDYLPAFLAVNLRDSLSDDIYWRVPRSHVRLAERELALEALSFNSQIAREASIHSSTRARSSS